MTAPGHRDELRPLAKIILLLRSGARLSLEMGCQVWCQEERKVTEKETRQNLVKGRWPSWVAFAREKKILASPEGHRQTGARSGPRLTLGHVPQKSRWSAVLP